MSLHPAIIAGAACAAAVAIGKALRAGFAGARDRHVRGSLIGRRRGKPARIGGALSLAGISVAPSDEVKHFKIIGATGTGKSTAIRELLGGALERGDRAVFADPDGGYRADFFHRHRGDIVLNPFDPEGVRWDWCAEIDAPGDIDQLAGCLIPDSDDAASSEWRSYARTFLAAVMTHCHAAAGRHRSDLWRLLTRAPTDEVRAAVAGTPAQPFLEPDNLRMFGSIRSVLSSVMAAFEHVQAQRARPFSVRDWVRSGGGVLFMPYKAREIQALRSLVAAWMHLAIFEAMSAEGDGDQRLWFVVDELDALGRIHGLKDALARLRKFGGRCVLGLQSIAQVSATYGAGDAQTLIENCGTTLILRCSASENGGTSQFASRLIGDREVLRRQVSRGNDADGAFGFGAGRRSRTVSEQRVTEPAVMPSELEQLADLTGYFKAPSSARWLRVDFRGPHRTTGRPARS